MNRMLKYMYIVLGLLWFNVLWAPPTRFEIKTWAENTFDSMTVDQRLAQLFMIEVRPTLGPAHLAQVEKTIKDHEVGGLIFFKGDPVEQVKLTNKYQNMVKVPMMVGIDGEWGLAMRLSNTVIYPYQLGLGSIQDNELLYEMGREIGRQCRRIGVHVNFAPVVDVNNNPNNPVINYRSFGENPINVAEKGWAYASGMQSAGVIACAKHFPGHGDTDVDSHKDLPVIRHDLERLNKIEFLPFRYMIDQGVQSVMTAHLFIPAIDDRKNIAVSISDKAINGILRTDMGFTGLAFTDALNMQGVAKYHPDGELELRALKAGNDILLAPGDIPKAVQLIKKAIANGSISEEYVWEKVKKILAYKQSLGLDNFQNLEEENVVSDLNNVQARYIAEKLVEKELCLIKDDYKLVPLHPGNKKKIVSVCIGDGKSSSFQDQLIKYGPITRLKISKDAPLSQFNQLKEQLRQFDIAIISIHSLSKYPPSYGITPAMAAFLKEAPQYTRTILVDFGNPYNLASFPGQKCVLMVYEDRELNHEKAAEALYGAVGIDGKLALSVGNEYKFGMGLTTHRLVSLRSGLPEEVGMSRDKLAKIDKIAEHAIQIGATPGCQILVAKDGQIVYQKSFGKHTYENGARAVRNTDMYDLASITKVAATTLTLMKLVEDSVLGLDDKMARYLPELLNTNKKHLTIRKVLEHKSGLKDWIPFYTETINDPKIYDSVYSSVPDATHNIYVGNNLYMLDSYKDYIFKKIYESEIEKIGEYKYSDLGMILMKELIERVTGMAFEEYVDETFYKPMGLKYFGFLPLNRYTPDHIIPTALSPDMRKGLVHGTVHDPAAAMLGGVSGHAGLFGNAESLAILMQMLLNGGEMNGLQYLKPETISLFTMCQAPDSRRGLGWDKPERDKRKINPASSHASLKCFGHSGFTGTIVWVDPQYELIYIFLSNRVYPVQNNIKLIKENTRKEIMDIVYESFLEP